jgi:hypothetical protein
MASQQPELPEAAHSDLDSMLSRKFGREIANYLYIPRIPSHLIFTLPSRLTPRFPLEGSTLTEP